MSLPRFESLISEHHDAIHRYLWRGLWSGGNPRPDRDAEDLTQQTFLRAFDAYGSLRDAANLRAWLYKIATNCLRTHWRKNADAPLPLEADYASGADGEARAVELDIANLADARLQRSLARLPTKQRQAVILRYLDELEYDQISQILACSQESARANVSHGLRRLREWMAADSHESQEGRK